MWDEDEETDDLEFDDSNGWLLKIDNKIIHSCIDKTDVVEYLINYLEDCFNTLDDDILNISSDSTIDIVENLDDLYEFLLSCDSDIFYITIKSIINYYDETFVVKMINIDGEEPEYSEL